jgi:drug/metabolite transporter (DMT)-like permease
MTRARFYLAGFAILVTCDTLTQVSFKLATHRLTPWIYIAIAGYIGAFVTWMTLLEHAPVGPSFAASHLDVVTVLIISVPLFGERLTTPQIIGAACIVAGILILSRSEAATTDVDSRPDARPATHRATPLESPADHRGRSARA